MIFVRCWRRTPKILYKRYGYIHASLVASLGNVGSEQASQTGLRSHLFALCLRPLRILYDISNLTGDREKRRKTYASKFRSIKFTKSIAVFVATVGIEGRLSIRGQLSCLLPAPPDVRYFNASLSVVLKSSKDV